MSSSVQLKVEGNIATITLNDPDRLNALTAEMGRNFTDTVKTLHQKVAAGEVKATIVTGAGKAFSAGGDIAWLKERNTAPPSVNQKTMVEFYNFYLIIRKLKCPTIAVINGPAVGAGAAMPLACDYRIAATDAKIGFPFVKLGIHPGMGSSLVLPRLVSQQFATHLLLGGVTITGEEAKRQGLVLEAVPAEEAMPLAISTAKNLLAAAPVALLSTLETLRMQKFAGLDLALEREAYAQAVCYATDDFLLGLEAVKTRQPPTFTGH